MTNEKISKSFIYFNLGILFSSIGTMTFLVTAMGAMSKMGFNVWDIGLFVGTFRFLPTLLSLVFSRFFIRMAHLKYYVPLELTSFALSLALAYLASRPDFNIYSFTALAVFSAILTLPQRANRPAIMKFLEEKAGLGHTRPALWLNKVTHGATFFSAIIGLSGLTVFSLSTIILFDAFTFLVSAACSYGVVKYILQMQNSFEAKSEEEAPTLQGLKEGALIFAKKIPLVFLLDFFLATILIGANMFSVRIAGEQPVLIPLLLMSYGLAVWVGGYLIRFKKFEEKIAWVWPLMGLGFCAVGFFPGRGVLTFGLTFICDLGYWLLFHYLTEMIQKNCDLKDVESVYFARNSLMALYLALGEFAVGGWANSLPLTYEGILRGAIAFAVFALLIFKHDKKVLN